MTTKPWQPSPSYQKIAEANRQFYAQIAQLYESTETCLTNPQIQQRLEADLDRVLAAVAKPVSSVRVLDACGGSGNISLKLLKRGAQVTLADISSDLLDLFLRKCTEQGFAPQTVCAEIGSFLAGCADSFDVITFSSALHHLENIDEVLRLAFDRLAPGGVLFTVFDPTARARLRTATRLLQRLEYYVFRAVHQSSDLPSSVLRRLRRIVSRWSVEDKTAAPLNPATVGMLAEYHVERGIDDIALVQRLRAMGFEVVWHERFAESRFGGVRRLIQVLGDATTFQLLVRRPARPTA